jgi:hypothetical protein
MLTAIELAQAIDQEKMRPYGGGWMVRCPAHNDNKPSLKIDDKNGKVLVHCFAGCTQDEVLDELKARDLWKAGKQDDLEQMRLQDAYDDFVRKLGSKDENERIAAAEAYLRGDQPKPYRLATMHDLLALYGKLPAESWNCGPIQAGSIGFIAAAAGVGKSMFALGLANAISTGADFDSWEVPHPQKVALFDVELSTRYLQKRIACYTWNIDNILLDWTDWRMENNVSPFLLGNHEHHQIVMQTCEDVDVIIIDNVTFALEAVKPGEIYSAETWNRVSELTQWARTREKTIIFIDHTNKAGQVAGAMNKTRSADWVITLDGLSIPGTAPLEFELSFEKCRYEVDKGLTRNKIARFDGDKWEFLYMQTEAEQFAELKADNKTMAEICEEMGIGKTKATKLGKAWSMMGR